MNRFAGIIGYFGNPDDLRRAIEMAKDSGVADVTAYLPLPDKAELDAADPGDSPGRWVALLGGISGVLTAIVMTVGTMWDWPLTVGGKSITSWPPFLVVAFELMVLFGSFGAIFGFLLFAHLPHLAPSPGYAPQLSVDTFALFVPCGENGVYRMRVEDLLRRAGAEQIVEVAR